MSSRRYGTFLESYGRERTEMRAMQGDASIEGKISEMSLAFTHSNYSKLFKEDTLALNRLPLLCSTLRHYLSNNGIIGILVCLHLIIIGLFSLSFARQGSTLHYLARYLLSCGMYGLIGGCINYFAITLFFKRIYGLCGSGIIYSHYQDICESVRTSIIDIFFDEAFLELYSKQKLSQQLVRLDIEGKLQSILQSEAVEQLINSELHTLATSPEGQVLSCAGINISSLKPLIKPFTLDLVAGAVPAIVESFFSYSQESGIQRLKQEVKNYTAKRRDKVTAERIVQLTRDVMYNHLSLLVVLGCTVGVLFGILSQVTGVGRVI